MSWTKLGDEFADECWTLSDPAFRLHVEGHVWSNLKSCDGKLAKDDMVRWAKRLEAAEELVAKGWWEDHGDHYVIIHHIGYQRTAEQVANQSKINADNRAKGKARPVRPKNKPSDESSEEPSDEMDRTGQDGHVLENSQKNSASNGVESFEEYRARAGVRANLNEFEAVIRANVERGYE
jgi:hypothetical protein